MSWRTGSHTGTGKSLAERGLLLLVVWVLLEGSVLPLGAASSPDTRPPPHVDNHSVTVGHNSSKKPFPVLSFDYHHIKIPFEISLWVLLASFMKLGEYRGDVTHVRLELPETRHSC